MNITTKELNIIRSVVLKVSISKSHRDTEDLTSELYCWFTENYKTIERYRREPYGVNKLYKALTNYAYKIAYKNKKMTYPHLFNIDKPKLNQYILNALMDEHSNPIKAAFATSKSSEALTTHYLTNISLPKIASLYGINERTLYRHKKNLEQTCNEFYLDTMNTTYRWKHYV